MVALLESHLPKNPGGRALQLAGPAGSQPRLAHAVYVTAAPAPHAADLAFCFSSAPALLLAFVVPLGVGVAAAVGAAVAPVRFSAGFVSEPDLQLGCDGGCDLGLTCAAWISSLFLSATRWPSLSLASTTAVSLSCGNVPRTEAPSGSFDNATVSRAPVLYLSVAGSGQETTAVECAFAGDGIFYDMKIRGSWVSLISLKIIDMGDRSL